MVVTGPTDSYAVEVRPVTHSNVKITIRNETSEIASKTVRKNRWVNQGGLRSLSRSLDGVSSESVIEMLKTARYESMCRSDWKQFMEPKSETVHAPSIEYLKSLTDLEEHPEIDEADVPTFNEVWNRRDQAVFDAMRDGSYTVIELPTAAGKSYIIATTEWTEHADKTGGEPVIHFFPTKKARDQAAKEAEEKGLSYYVLESRLDLCGYAAGDYDDEIEVDGTPVSQWFEEMCSVRQLSFSEAKDKLERIIGEEHDCSDEHDECPAALQFDEIRDTLKHEPEHDVIFATHSFAHVPLIRHDSNLVVDEMPQGFCQIGPGAQNGGRDEDGPFHQRHVKNAVNAFLINADAPIQNVQNLMSIAQREARGLSYNEVREEFPDLYERVFHHKPHTDWYWEHADAAKPARAWTKALWEAARKEPDINGRRAAMVQYRPPRLKTGPINDREETLKNNQWLTVVIDDNNDICTLRIIPNFDDARSVIGLDAHPCEERWRLNVGPQLDFQAPLDEEERRLFRRFRRRLLVIQCGSGNYSYNNPERVNTTKVGAFFDALRNQYDENFRSALPPKGSLELTEGLMKDAGVDEPLMLNQERAKSRNDFEGEQILTTIGCGDPGDDYVIDLLAEAGHEATPERDSDGDCSSCGGDNCKSCQWTGNAREFGRGFDGPGDDAAASILASVRENDVAQAVGRGARDPIDPDDWAAVFVWGQAIPDSLVDYQGITVDGYSNERQAILKYLRDQGEATQKEMVEGVSEEAEDVDSVSTTCVSDLMQELTDNGDIAIKEDAGPYNADVYKWTDLPSTKGSVDFTMEEVRTARRDQEPIKDPIPDDIRGGV